MNAERWQQIRSVFDAVNGLPPSERDSTLDRLCAGDPALRSEVAALLRSAEEAGSFLDQPASGRLSRSEGQAAPAASAAPQQLGPHRVLREIGHGGMGIVYLAEHVELKRQVAIKVVRWGMELAVTQRFLAEQRILARLEHPWIARLYDSGTTADGRPFFVMEYIAGENLISGCDQRKLPIPQRVALFSQACAAVQYAHQRLIVHRDLKPSNILVTADGTPKLLDFGIAKLLEPENENDSGFTTVGLRPMTLEYASPEQVRSQPVTTGSDVYSLGVVLYELLTGCSPYRPRSTARQDLEDAVLVEEPERPSIATGRPAQAGEQELAADERARRRGCGQPSLRRLLSGDLDNIVLKALRKEPDRRYASASELAEDLGRWATGQPVLAQTDSLAYRSRKFVRRHRRGLTVAVAIAALIAALTLLYNRRLTSERDQAQREREGAQQVSSFLASLFQLSDPDRTRGVKLSAQDVVDRGAERIGRELATQPALAAKMMTLTAQLYRGLDLREPALRQLQQALVLLRRSEGFDHPDIAATERELANLQHLGGDDAAARPLLLDALRINEAQPDGKQALETARTLTALGNVARTSGDVPGSSSLLHRAMLIELHLGAGAASDLEATLNNYGLTLRRAGENRQAVMVFRRLAMVEPLRFGPLSPRVGKVLGNLGAALTAIGDADGAIEVLERCLTIVEHNYGRSHREYSGTLNDLANAWKAKGDRARARQLYEQALAAFTTSAGPTHPDTLNTRRNLGLLLLDTGDARSALPHLQAVLASREQVLGGDHPDTALSQLDVGKALDSLGQRRQAEAMMRHALSVLGAKLPADSYWIALGQADLGGLLCESDRRPEGLPLLAAALRGLRRALPPGDPLVAQVSGALSRCQASSGAPGGQGG